MQIYPTGWKTGDSPCYLMIGNWLDGENGEMMSRCNIVLVLRAAGKQQNDDPAKPYEYGVNEWIGSPPQQVDCPVNNRNMFMALWQPICKMCIKVW